MDDQEKLKHLIKQKKMKQQQYSESFFKDFVDSIHDPNFRFETKYYDSKVKITAYPNPDRLKHWNYIDEKQVLFSFTANIDKPEEFKKLFYRHIESAYRNVRMDKGLRGSKSIIQQSKPNVCSCAECLYTCPDYRARDEFNYVCPKCGGPLYGN